MEHFLFKRNINTSSISVFQIQTFSGYKHTSKDRPEVGITLNKGRSDNLY